MGAWELLPMGFVICPHDKLTPGRHLSNALLFGGKFWACKNQESRKTVQDCWVDSPPFWTWLCVGEFAVPRTWWYSIEKWFFLFFDKIVGIPLAARFGVKSHRQAVWFSTYLTCSVFCRWIGETSAFTAIGGRYHVNTQLDPISTRTLVGGSCQNSVSFTLGLGKALKEAVAYGTENSVLGFWPNVGWCRSK